MVLGRWKTDHGGDEKKEWRPEVRGRGKEGKA